ncbi:hypothetical protein HNV11_03195 [Spirosoma taeanense]|uniref:Uncharacterized protein n=1 Tax=Spirosoma taeanense TaxID=2735870 RepID=A0A6M5Y121_9BACT|nr:hypothetical protein [Spirosoma taeanense]QJW88447.1 hypothetical protein HNV11_03195 [Spirosoma taeanense]
MVTLIDHLTPSDDVELIGSRIGRLDPDNFSNQSGAAMEDDEADEADDVTEDNGLYDEPTDEDGDPTGEHDHHQDDNYALGGHVTRSGSV